ncbi:hypothetical protein HDV00_011144 [Rhizophlyctis rosea]|nr:hypothetical protein HDV00_011144 [Rhizophlyctis rosea]
MPQVRVGNHEFGERTPLIGYGGAEADRKRMGQACRQVIALLVVAYTGYYFVRSNLAVAIPILEEEEISRTKIGFVLGAGYTAFLIGKFLSGTIIRRIGGKTTLLLGLVGSIVTSVLFTFKATPVWFGTFRFLNQLAESVGWSAVVKIVRGWYAPSEAAHAIAFASLAESGGDAVVRLVLGGSLLYGLGWKEMFYLSAAAGTGLEPPKETGGSGQNLQERSVYAPGESGVRPLLKSGRFWILSAQMFGIILIRESFASFTSAFIKEELELSTGLSAIASAIFPALGAISSLAGGLLLDHVRPSRRGLVPFLCLGVVTAGLGGMAVECYQNLHTLYQAIDPYIIFVPASDYAYPSSTGVKQIIDVWKHPHRPKTLVELFGVEGELREIWEAHVGYRKPRDEVLFSFCRKIMVDPEWLRKKREREEEEMDSDDGE